jgi:hypothetical protein
MGLDAFWEGYDRTLKRVRDEKPTNVTDLAAILNAFQPPSAGVAFFGNNADDQLPHALRDAGWDVQYIEGDYLWDAVYPPTKEWIHCVEGDLYAGRWRSRS